MRTFIFLFAVAATVLSTANAQQQDKVTEVSLGDGVQAHLGYDNNVKYLYLPGRAIPIHIPVLVYVSQAVVSPNRQLLVLNRRSDRGGGIGLLCLPCLPAFEHDDHSRMDCSLCSFQRRSRPQV